MLTQDELKKQLHYNPKEGSFTWLVNRAPKVKIGNIAGTIFKSKYIRIELHGRAYFAHRLAWLYVYGIWPKEELDHIDGNGLNNTLDNIRQANIYQNRQNRPINSLNTSGYKGVSWLKSVGLWAAYCSSGNRRFYLGRFDNPELAANVRNVFAREMHGRFYRE